MTTAADERGVESVEFVLPSSDLAADLAFFTGLGFRIEQIFPADAPRVAVVGGSGVRLRLDGENRQPPASLRLATAECPTPESRTSPGGTTVHWVPADPALELPPENPTFSLCRRTAADHWAAGRAGMQYRDLLPDRQGGRFIASHIRIPEGGPVADYVHYHHVRFQMIYCWKGWVEVVYEDQGDPFILDAGDCVLQPPGIRHRVLQASPGLEVIEIGSPAEHLTGVDHGLSLPTGRIVPERRFEGQRFVRFRGSQAAWEPWLSPGLIAAETGIAAATDGLADVSIVRSGDGRFATPVIRHGGEFLFYVVLEGRVTLSVEGREHDLHAGDACAVPRGMDHALEGDSPDFRMIEVALPARAAIEH